MGPDYLVCFQSLGGKPSDTGCGQNMQFTLLTHLATGRNRSPPKNAHLRTVYLTSFKSNIVLFNIVVL